MEYETFAGNLADLPLGKEFELIARDLTPGRRKYSSHRLIAMLSEEALPDSHKLWIRSRAGVPYSKPLFMQIIRELELIRVV